MCTIGPRKPKPYLSCFTILSTFCSVADRGLFDSQNIHYSHMLLHSRGYRFPNTDLPRKFEPHLVVRETFWLATVLTHTIFRTSLKQDFWTVSLSAWLPNSKNNLINFLAYSGFAAYTIRSSELCTFRSWSMAGHHFPCQRNAREVGGRD